MKTVGSTFCGGCNYAAGVTAVFRGRVSAYHAKFLGCIDVRSLDTARNARHIRVVVIDSIDDEIVISFARSIDRKTAEACISLDRTRRKQHERRGVARQQRQIKDLAVIYD